MSNENLDVNRAEAVDSPRPTGSDKVGRTSTSASATLQQQLSDLDKSAMERYQLVTLGTTSKFKLLKFELVTLLAAGIPGALGLVLRKFLYPKILGSVGRNVVFGKGITLRHPDKIRIADNVVIDDGVVLDAKGDSNSGISLGEGVFISRNAILSCKNGDISIGRGSIVGVNNLIHALEGSNVVLGDDVLIAAFVYLIGSGPYRMDELDVPFKKQGMQPKGGVHIGNNVWIGSGTHVLDGVTVGQGAVLASNGFVNKDVQPFDIVGGVPARLIKSRQNVE